jgi:hypothetical protein
MPTEVMITFLQRLATSVFNTSNTLTHYINERMQQDCVERPEKYRKIQGKTFIGILRRTVPGGSIDEGAHIAIRSTRT